MQTWNLIQLDAPEGTRSPVVLHSEQGVARAVLIALHPGQELGDHQVKEHAWLTVVEGHVAIDSDAGLVDAGPGTVVKFDPGESHSVRSEDGARILLLLAPWPGDGHYRGEEVSL